MEVSVIIAGAGKGIRAGFSKNKLLVEIDWATTLSKTFDAFYSTGIFNQYVITASKEDYEEIKNAFPNATVVLGGATRTESIKNALPIIDSDIVLIHDGARPNVTKKMIESCISVAKQFGSAIPVIPTRDTLAKCDGNIIENYIGKNGYYSIQTPQGFNTKEIKEAYSKIDGAFNDDGEIYATYIKPLHTFIGDSNNIKLTFKEDFINHQTRFGVGFDCHKLVENRKLILGGIEIPHTKGLLGHSDADVLTHAIMDAILSGACMRDIGYHFPDSDAKYKDANSIELLKKVLNIIGEQDYKVDSISAVIMADKPKLLNFIPLMQDNIAKTLNISKGKVGISATTLEGLGFVGREEGICVHANAVLIK